MSVSSVLCRTLPVHELFVMVLLHWAEYRYGKLTFKIFFFNWDILWTCSFRYTEWFDTRVYIADDHNKLSYHVTIVMKFLMMKLQKYSLWLWNMQYSIITYITMLYIISAWPLFYNVVYAPWPILFPLYLLTSASQPLICSLYVLGFFGLSSTPPPLPHTHM